MQFSSCPADAGSSRFPSAFGGITYPVVISRLLYWTVDVSDMIWGITAEQTQQDLVNWTEEDLYYSVCLTDLLSRAWQLEEN